MSLINYFYGIGFSYIIWFFIVVYDLYKVYKDEKKAFNPCVMIVFISIVSLASWANLIFFAYLLITQLTDKRKYDKFKNIN